MTLPLCLKPAQWPEVDRRLWAVACQPAGFLKSPHPASLWSVSRRRIVEQAYGQWLSWLARNGLLNANDLPGIRVGPDRVKLFIEELQARISPMSVAMMVGALKCMLDILAPEASLTWLSAWSINLKKDARPQRNRFEHIVPPAALMDLGLSLLRAAEEDKGESHLVSTMARDGLMISMLICQPDRIGNFHAIEIGRHLLFAGDRYRLRFEAHETKTGHVSEGELPPGLTPWIEWYLDVHRQRLLMQGTNQKTTRLWIDRWGQAMSSSSVRSQINKRTIDAFGANVWPHLFRACAVTGLVDIAPDQIAIAPDLLGHTTSQTTRKHYILARGNRAHGMVQETFLSARAQALARLKRGDGEDA